MPWDHTTPLGYTGEILFGALLSEAYLIGNGSILMLFVCMCLHHKAFFKMFEQMVHKLDLVDRGLEAKNRLCEIIQFYVSAKTCVF